jgi:hypothetical protein
LDDAARRKGIARVFGGEDAVIATLAARLTTAQHTKAPQRP